MSDYTINDGLVTVTWQDGLVSNGWSFWGAEFSRLSPEGIYDRFCYHRKHSAAARSNITTAIYAARAELCSEAMPA